MSDRVALKGMRFHTRVGVLPHEAELPQPVEVDLAVTVEDTVRPPDVVDYVALYAAVAEVMATPHIAYLEDAAERVAAAALLGMFLCLFPWTSTVFAPAAPPLRLARQRPRDMRCAVLPSPRRQPRRVRRSPPHPAASPCPRPSQRGPLRRAAAALPRAEVHQREYGNACLSAQLCLTSSARLIDSSAH